MEQLQLRGTLKGHSGWVTQIATTPQDPNQILSASRGKINLLPCLDLVTTTSYSLFFMMSLKYFRQSYSFIIFIFTPQLENCLEN